MDLRRAHRLLLAVTALISLSVLVLRPMWIPLEWYLAVNFGLLLSLLLLDSETEKASHKWGRALKLFWSGFNILYKGQSILLRGPLKMAYLLACLSLMLVCLVFALAWLRYQFDPGQAVGTVTSFSISAIRQVLELLLRHSETVIFTGLGLASGELFFKLRERLQRKQEKKTDEPQT
jgi:hypothetical protein